SRVPIPVNSNLLAISPNGGKVTGRRFRNLYRTTCQRMRRNSWTDAKRHRCLELVQTRWRTIFLEALPVAACPTGNVSTGMAGPERAISLPDTCRGMQG